MKDNGHILLNNLLYSCVANKQRGNEQFVHEHALGYIISGETHFLTDRGETIAYEGTLGLAKRNQLVKSVKVPPAVGEYKAINIFLDQEFLRDYAAENRIEVSVPYSGESMIALKNDPFLKGYFISLLPYFDYPRSLNPALARIKTREAVELLLQYDPTLKNLLFDFSVPHKIDLEAYMNLHYMYNVPTTRFASLTGRSLAAFKRDFEKIFKQPPSRWLLQKRLKEAHFLITEKGQKPSAVYLEVGFENLSHFSYSFKKAYGVAPSML